MDDDSCLPSLEEMERIRNRYNKGFDMQTLADIVGMVSNCLESGKLAWVVRCKDCRFLIDHYGFMDDGYCRKMKEEYCVKFKPDKNWFCADGVKRE